MLTTPGLEDMMIGMTHLAAHRGTSSPEVMARVG
jgi:hypothetical protein